MNKEDLFDDEFLNSLSPERNSAIFLSSFRSEDWRKCLRVSSMATWIMKNTSDPRMGIPGMVILQRKFVDPLEANIKVPREERDPLTQ